MAWAGGAVGRGRRGSRVPAPESPQWPGSAVGGAMPIPSDDLLEQLRVTTRRAPSSA